MKLETTFLQSKLARRIFWLFVLCALIPISVFALFSLRNVTAQLQEQSRRRLDQASREEAMIIYERLSFLEAEMRQIGVGIHGDTALALASTLDSPNAFSPEFASHFESVAHTTAEGHQRTLFGKAVPRFAFSTEEQKHLSSGKNVLSAVPCNESGECIFLTRVLDTARPAEGTLTAEINAAYLWGADALPSDVEICVLDPAGRTLFCSGKTPDSFPARVTQSFSGEFEWQRGGSEFLANYWNLSLADSFLAPHWTIVASEAKADILAPLSRFRTSFLLVCLLALWIVLLLSLVQIRRSLIPLGKLKDGTRRISDGNFQTRVMLDSGDEFEELASSFNFMAGRIEKQLNSLKVINELDRAVLSASNIEKIVDTLAMRLAELLPLDLVAVNLFDSDESLAVQTYIYGPGSTRERLMEIVEINVEEMREISSAPGVSILTGAGSAPSYLKPLSARGMRYFLRVPVVLDGRAVAVITLARAAARDWTEEDKEHMRQLGDQVAVAFSNSRLVSELRELQWGTLTALARAIDAKSPWTLGHSERVTDWAVKIAKAMGLPSKELEIIRRGGLLHDIGKIGTAVSILDKPGRLTDEEFKEMEKHVMIGERILRPIPGLADSMPIVLQHHEWVDGTGYPNGLKGEEISLHARIFAVADCFDALISDRPYRAGLPLERVMQILQQGSGTHFDPRVLEVFQKLIKQEDKQAKFEEAHEAMLRVS